MRVVLMGDVMLGREVAYHMRHVAPEYFWGNTLELIRGADFSLLNLECALTTSGEIWSGRPKYFYFRADPDKAVDVLKAANIRFVNLANNHVLDFGEQGLRDTLDALTRSGIGFCGAGLNVKEAREVKFMEAGGVRLALLGLTDNIREWRAGMARPGVHYRPIRPASLRKLSSGIMEAKANADLLIASLHWGPNMVRRPPVHFREFARCLLDSGVDLIHGHSAHLVQGVEVRGSKAILYDCGDYIDDYAVDAVLRNDQSVLTVVTVEDKRIRRLELYPVLIRHFQANLAEGAEREEIFNRLLGRSGELGIILTKGNERLILEL